MPSLRAVVLVSFVSCSPVPKGEPELSIRVAPASVKAGEPVQVVVTATGADGLVGKGVVHLDSELGSLSDGVDLELDTYGTATATFSCAQPCLGPVELNARWNVVRAKSRVEILSAVRCDFGTVSSAAAPGMLDLFGTVLYFDNGAPLPAGNYRIKNTGGCLKYGPGQNWCVNAYLNGSVAWWVVGATTNDRLFVPPGTFGFAADNTRDVGFAEYAACDAANRALPAHDFVFAGGKLGLWLKDLIYNDNTSGTGKNPSWSLTRLTADCP